MYVNSVARAVELKFEAVYVKINIFFNSGVDNDQHCAFIHVWNS